MAYERFETLPQNVQEEAKSVLKAFDEVYVVYEYGEYKVSTALCIKKTYAPDHRFVGTYKASEVYTEKEQIENYINEFCDYPMNYKGARNYDLLREIKESRNYENGVFTQKVGKILEDGNFSITGMMASRV